MPDFKVVRQHNSWSCYACVAAMATKTTLEDVINFVGHDGSAIEPDSPHPDKRAGFSMSEINRFMAEHKVLFGAVGCNISGFKHTFPKEYTHIDVRIPIDLPAMICVRSSMSNFDGNHCLFWDGKRLWDPYFDDAVKLKDYKLNEWWPLANLQDR